MTEPPEDCPRIGDTLPGGWTLGERLGAGGVGVVHVATRPNGERAAIKLLRRHLWLGVEAKHRLRREASVAQRLKHPGIALVHEVGEFAGAPFLVMELLEGESLETRRLREKRLPIELVVRLTRELLVVFQHAHSMGVVHRDVKPSNLFLTRDGRLKVLDFGLARDDFAADSASFKTVSSVVMGTPGFMAPEQARGRSDLVDHRSDIWSIGATLHILITGHPVHSAATPSEQLGLTMSVRPEPIRNRDPNVDPALARVVDRALSFDPDARWQSAADMLRALDGAIGRSASERCVSDLGLPAHATQPASFWGGKGRSRKHQRPQRAALIAAAVVTATAAAIANRAGPSVGNAPVPEMQVGGVSATTPSPSVALPASRSSELPLSSPEVVELSTVADTPKQTPRAPLPHPSSTSPKSGLGAATAPQHGSAPTGFDLRSSVLDRRN